MCITSLQLQLMLSNKTASQCNHSVSRGSCPANVSNDYIQLEYDTNNDLHTVPVNPVTLTTLDTTKYDFPNTIWYMIPHGEVTLKVATFVPIILFGVIGNFLLITIILRNRSLKTPTNLLIANMAAADLATLLICPIMVMYRDFFQNYELGAIGCKMEGFLQASLLITAVLNLCAISYDRLTAIVLPQETRLTIRGAQYLMVATWIIGFVLSAPLITFRTYKERQWKNFLETYCSENISILPMYWHVLICAMVWLPLAVMLICYSAIFWKLDRYEQKVLKRENPISVSYKRKVAKMMFMVLIIFIIFRLPFTALVFIRNQMLKESKINQVQGAFLILWYTSHYLIFCNAAINPIIYGLTNDNFRKAYRQTPLLRLFCKADVIPGTRGKSSAFKNYKMRINNMLLGQSDSKDKGNKNNKKFMKNSDDSSSSSGIWNTVTKKTNLKETTQIHVISTNLNDSTVDPDGKF